MKPCDCKDIYTVSKLPEQGLRFNDLSIVVRPNKVIIDHGPATLRIPMDKFRAFAEWYLEDQDAKEMPERIERAIKTARR